MQSAMQMFVARFASKDPLIRGGTDAKRTPNIGGISFYVWGGMNAGVGGFTFQVQHCLFGGDSCIWGRVTDILPGTNVV